MLDERVRAILAQRGAATNEAIKLELLVGCRTAEEYKSLGDRLVGILQLPVRTSTWKAAAALGFRLRRGGLVVSFPDLIIAASAIEHDAVLLHADRDFDRIAANSDLRVESHADSVI